MPVLHLIPFFCLNKGSFNNGLSMCDITGSYAYSRPHDGCFIYESSIILNIDFRKIDPDFWQSFLFRAATPLRNPQSLHAADQNGKDELTCFMEYFVQWIEECRLSISAETLQLVEEGLRSKLAKKKIWPINFETVANVDTLVLNMDFSFDSSSRNDESVLELFTKYGLLVNASSYQAIYFQAHLGNTYTVGPIEEPFGRSFLDKVVPNGGELCQSFPLTVINELKEGVGRSRPIQKILASLREFLKLGNSLFWDKFSLILKHIPINQPESELHRIYLADLLVLAFQLNLLNKTLEESDFTTEGNAPVTFCYKSKKVSVEYPFPKTISKYDLCACIFPTSWYGTSSKKKFNTVATVGMKLSANTNIYSIIKECPSYCPRNLQYLLDFKDTSTMGGLR